MSLLHELKESSALLSREPSSESLSKDECLSTETSRRDVWDTVHESGIETVEDLCSDDGAVAVYACGVEVSPLVEEDDEGKVVTDRIEIVRTAPSEQDLDETVDSLESTLRIEDVCDVKQWKCIHGTPEPRVVEENVIEAGRVGSCGKRGEKGEEEKEETTKNESKKLTFSIECGDGSLSLDQLTDMPGSPIRREDMWTPIPIVSMYPHTSSSSNAKVQNDDQLADSFNDDDDDDDDGASSYDEDVFEDEEEEEEEEENVEK